VNAAKSSNASNHPSIDHFFSQYSDSVLNTTRSSATAEKQRVSHRWLPGLVSWPSDGHT